MSNECKSQTEVSIQDSGCDVITQSSQSEATSKDSNVRILDKLVAAVDSMAGKLGDIESRFIWLEAAKPG